MSDYPIPGVDMTPEQRLEWWERVAFIEGAKRERLEGCIATIRYLHAPRDSRLVDEDGIVYPTQECTACRSAWPCETLKIIKHLDAGDDPGPLPLHEHGLILETVEPATDEA